MKIEIQEKLIAALESGKYAKGSGSLRNGGQYCCLGVLGQIAIQEGVVESYFPGAGYLQGDGPNDNLNRIAEWAECSPSEQSFLASLNDESLDFGPVIQYLKSGGYVTNHEIARVTA